MDSRGLYDRLSGEYGLSSHNTVRYYIALEQLHLLYSCIHTMDVFDIPHDKFRVLNIGVGDDSHRYMLTEYPGLCLTKNQVVDLDISKLMLEKSQGIHYRVQADGIMLPFKDASFNMVIGGLVDHIVDAEKLFEESYRVLDMKGAFAVTYPYSKLSRTIREKLYGINPDTTRFVIDGKEHLIQSRTLETFDVERLFKASGFANLFSTYLTDSNRFWQNNDGPSQTIKKAAKTMHKKHSVMNVLVFGYGTKSYVRISGDFLFDQLSLAERITEPKKERVRPWDGLP